jgi:leader peptidase (prepilin peptidase) / N-methyltransferase
MHLLFPVAAGLAAAACGWPACALVIALGTATPAAADRPADGRAASGDGRAGRERLTQPADGRAPSGDGRAGRERLTQPAAVLVTSLVLGALAVGIAVRLHPAAVATAGCWLAVCGVPMTIIDVRQRRLPDALTWPCLAGTAALLTAAAAVSGDWPALGRAGLGALAVAAFFALLAFARPGSAGLGDAKLALSTGALAAWFGWPVLVSAMFTAFIVAAGYGVWLMASGRASLRGSSVPFGPFLLVGCLLAVAVLPR